MKDTILVVDHSIVTRNLIVKRVRMVGLKFADAGTIEEVIAMLDAGSIALIIGPIHSSNLLGKVLMELIRNTPPYQSTPVLVLLDDSASSLDTTLPAGNVDHLKFPFSNDELMAKIEQLSGIRVF